MSFNGMQDGKDSQTTTTESTYAAYASETQGARHLIYRNVIVINDSNDDRVLVERVTMVIDSTDNVYFREFIQFLRSKNLIQANSSIFFYDVERNIFVHQGSDPITTDIRIPLLKFSIEEIKIKFRPAEQKSEIMKMSMAGRYTAANNNPIQPKVQPAAALLARRNCYGDQQRTNSRSGMCFPNNVLPSRQGDSFYTTQQQPPHSIQFLSDVPFNSTAMSEMIEGADEGEYYDDVEDMMMLHDSNQIDMVGAKPIPREKRVKERKIGYVHERVLEWRRYYEEGVINEQGKNQKVNLDVAAGLVGLSRKTLDDYYKYIRKAEGYNFDFKGRSEEKIGVLRNFVRDRQNRMSKVEQLQESQSTEDDKQTSQPKEEEQCDDYHQDKAIVVEEQKYQSTMIPQLKIEEQQQQLQQLPQNYGTRVLPRTNLQLPPPYKHELAWLEQHQQPQSKNQLQENQAENLFDKRMLNSIGADPSATNMSSSTSMDIEADQTPSAQQQLMQLPLLTSTHSFDYSGTGINLLKQQSIIFSNMAQDAMENPDHWQNHQSGSKGNESDVMQVSSQFQQYQNAFSTNAACPQDAPDEEFDYLNSETELRRTEQED